jgi:5,10-methylenetetrahydrofolate reductase
MVAYDLKNKKKRKLQPLAFTKGFLIQTNHPFSRDDKSMKILNEFVPTRKFLKLAEEIAPLVDGWNVTDSAAGFPAPSGTVVSCILKSKYPEKEVCPIFILHYKGPVEVGGLALAADIMGVNGLAITMGDVPKFGEPIKMLKSSEEARDWLRTNVKLKTLKLGCLLTARRSVEETIERAKGAWDFIYFMRLEDKSFPILEQVAKECKKMGKPIYAYFLVGTSKNVETVKMIGWPVAATMDTVEEKAAKLVGLVDGIIATCAGDAEGDKEMLQKLQKFRNK